jgi:ribonuclease E
VAEADARAAARERPTDAEPGEGRRAPNGRDHEAGSGHAAMAAEPGARVASAEDEARAAREAVPEAEGDDAARENGGHIEEVDGDGAEAPEMVGASLEQGGAEDALEEVPERSRRHIRSYKIQEVIKRRQIILVQVVKEERGSKGAALTTYLSLAGRYTVLMPNTGRGGGISRKITNPQDRKRLKAIAQDLEVPEGMGLIIRTAGAARTKQEIKRDFEYLLRLWENVRDMTLQSTAPSLVYEEGNLIKRSLRDLYSKDIDEIQVAGTAAFDEAQAFMRMLSPSQAKNVVKYEEPEALFSRYQIERQLNAMFSPYVTLRSGGYLVINQTEALVSVDVNSGKSTREFSIEETALQTNLEASDEIARQVKLRDLAGLIVIDFIDMEERRNNRKVEGRLKDALRHDRARIQVGRISHFGLLEMSRQRLRTGVMEGSTTQCPHCQGTGIVRSTESVALAVLRALEDHLVRDSRSSLTAIATAAVALYILNSKRSFVTEMEHRYGVAIAVQASDRMHGANFAIEKSAAPVAPPRVVERSTAVNMGWAFDDDEGEGEEVPSPAPALGSEAEEAESPAESDERRSRRRRRRSRREDGGERGAERGRAEPLRSSGSGESAPETLSYPDEEPAAPEATTEALPEIPGLGEQPSAALGDDERPARRRRRGRRGGRRGRDREGLPEGSDADAEIGAEAGAHEAAETEAASAAERPELPDEQAGPEAADGVRTETGPSPAGEPVQEAALTVVEADVRQTASEAPPPVVVEPAPEPAPALAEAAAEGAAAASAHVEPAHSDPTPRAPVESDPLKPTRKGWWQRRIAVD